MNAPPSLLAHALAQARADWLAGDPAAWRRYAACLAKLASDPEDHTAPSEALAKRPLRPRRPAPSPRA